MIIKIEVNNAHLQRLAKAMNYAGPPIAQNPQEFKTFIENWIVSQFRESIKSSIFQEQVENAIKQQLPPNDVAPIP